MKRAQFEASLSHLRGTKYLKNIELKTRKPPFKRPSDPFESLVRSIIYQQLSGKAAGTILGRLLICFRDATHPDGRYPYS